MRKKLKRGLIACLCACLLAGGATGCSRFENTEIVLTTGLTENQLFKVGSSVCTLPEAMIYVMDYQRQYESVYGVEMWEHDFGGITLEEYVKNIIVSQLAAMKAVTLLAKDYEIDLTESETENVKKAAKEYYSSMGSDAVKYMGLAQEDVENLYRDHVLSRKVYHEITKNVNTEVSDDEARIITVQQIKMDSVESAKKILEDLAEGKEFMTLASAYSQDSQITYTFGRGEKSSVYEEAAFALENDGVSDIIEEEDGYYILKCVNNFDREATEANKITMVERRRDEIFSEVYEDLVANTPSEFNTRIWEQIHFEDWKREIPESFLEVYSRYFEEE
ncbi:MAG: hypothetical protein HFI19_06030 [Lachnospiraceae bacterium]|jgi:foldase protein PrsA|uniref:peptidylprolyl isomerase n=1 Tax=Candidatus Merdisoma sp. JLR.KK006 TaxID=3112626 RepID=UPI002FF2A1E2|nr:hypothetical protein [Lachnospiraceae bacterium]